MISKSLFIFTALILFTRATQVFAAENTADNKVADKPAPISAN